MCSPMPDDMGESEVPPVCSKWPGCEGTHGEGSYFDVDSWRWSDSTCNWPTCAVGIEP